MKKLCFTLVLLTIVTAVRAQRGGDGASRHEFKIGIGIASAPQVSGMAEVLSDENIFGSAVTSESELSAVFHLNYNFYLQPRWDIGVSVVYELQKHSQVLDRPVLLGAVKYNDAYYSLLLGSRYHWLQQGVIDLYSGGDLGYSYAHRGVKEQTGVIQFSGKNSGGLAYQVTPIGMRIGKTFNGFIELGYGYKGLLVLGLAVRL